MLILDEATSALDSKSERLIQESIESLSGNQTIICIAHRLATIKIADLIYNIESGKIIEEGSFSELVSLKGKFFSSVLISWIIKTSGEEYLRYVIIFIILALTEFTFQELIFIKTKKKHHNHKKILFLDLIF